MDSTNLSGFWTGQYWYDHVDEWTVGFLALLSDEAGVLSGEITEPNTIGYSSSELKAWIRGTCDGQAVTFAKVYDGASDAAHRVDYVGTLSDDSKRIAGHWMIDGEFGGFSMSRTLLPAEELDAEPEAVREGTHR